jgi:hypothetical protein
MPALPFRQLHLDFHTSPAVSGVGADFDSEAFVRALQRMKVQSVTCFSRCHHGLIYHDTRFDDLRHPGLSCDLLGRQIEACHRAGIRAPVYISVGWDDLQRRRHPEWLERDEHGHHRGPGPLEPGFEHKLCLNTPYVDFLAEQTAEVLQRFDCDGLFFDIVHQGPCLCERCLQSMARKDLDPASPADRRRHAEQLLDAFKRRMTGLVRQRAPEASIFYNAGHLGPETRRTLDLVTHLELESLPTGHWGHLHFPITVRHARGMGPPLLGLTAAFHGSWGDLCAPKSLEALESECFQMLAQGARCSVGTQLLPGGSFEPAMVELLERVYGQVQAREPWCEGARPQTEVGVFHPEAFGASDGPLDSSAAGALMILGEGHQQFDFLDGRSDFQRYRVILVPDRIRVGPELARALSGYLGRGGALLLCHLGGLAPEADRFALAEVGARCLGLSPVEPDFLVPGPQLAAALPGGPLAMKWRAMRVCPEAGTEVLAGVRLPLLERTRRAFYGHQHAPPGPGADYPAAIQRGRVLYLAHPVLSMYRQQAWPWCRDLLLAALSRLLPDPLVKTGAPRTCQVTVTAQPHHRRRVLHLLHYIPRPVGERFAVVDETLPLSGVELALRCDAPPRRVTLEPGAEPLPLTFEPPYARFTVPQVRGHQLVVVHD